jgi:signal transduction histidine kinase
VLCAADDGAGIAETECERVFERLHRGAGRGDARGSEAGRRVVGYEYPAGAR